MEFNRLIGGYRHRVILIIYSHSCRGCSQLLSRKGECSLIGQIRKPASKNSEREYRKRWRERR